MKKITKLLTGVITGILAVLLAPLAANAQCAAGQVAVSFDVTTDQWGYELYWVLVPTGDACGSANQLFAGGTTAVGCSGAGARVASAGAGSYGNSLTVTEGPICLTNGAQYCIIAVDDWGDGGNTIESTSQGFTFNTVDGNDTFCFTASAAVPYDLAIGVPSEDANGWTRDYVRIPGFTYWPETQVRRTELMFGATVANRGINSANNAVISLNVERFTPPTTFTSVYNDTISLGTILPDSLKWGYKDMNDSTWCTAASYRYTYIITHSNPDNRASSDTITGFFDITADVWSKVDFATDGGPFGTGAYLPGVTAPNIINKMEWGSLYYMPNGSGVSIDTLKVRFFMRTDNNASSAIYQARVYRITDGNNSNSFDDILVDKSLEALVSDTVAVVPNSQTVRRLSNFLDINTFGNYEFADDELYYISIYQNNSAGAGLNNGTNRNGLLIYGQTFNHDPYVYGNGSNFQFYNPLIIQETASGVPAAEEGYEYGWTGGPEPSMILNLSTSSPTAVVTEKEELAGVEVFPNPATNQLNVNLNLDQASDVRFILTDAVGRVIDIKYANNVSTETRSWDITNFPAGVYFLHVKANGVSTSKKVVKR